MSDVLDEAPARRLVDSQFARWSHLPVAAVELDGWVTRTFRLGSELTVRLPTPAATIGHEIDGIPTDHARER